MNLGDMALRGIGDECYAINIIRNLKYDLKQDLICGQILSLKYVAISEIAHTLWRTHLCKIKLSEIEHYDLRDTFDKYEKEINKKISNLNIPKVWQKKLKEFIRLIKEEIQIILNDDRFMNFFFENNVQIFWDNLCWTQQVSVDKVLTAVQIIDNSNLNIVDKYVLACDNCLEEKIMHLHKFLPEDFLAKFEWKNKDANLGNDPNYLVLFWTYYIEGKQEKFLNFISGTEPYNYLLKWSIHKGKETAVQYIWEKFGNEELKEHLNDYFERSIYRKSNIAFYFFQQLSKIHQEEKIGEVLNILLRKVRNVLRWSDAFAIESYVFEMIKLKNVFDALKIIVSCGNEKLLDLNQYKTLLNEYIFNFKLELKENFINICKKFCWNCNERDKDYFMIKYSALLRAGTSKDIKIHMYSDDAGDVYERLIVLHGPDFMDAILKQAFKTEEEILEFEKHFFSTMGGQICADLIREDKYEWANTFLNKYCIEIVRTEFKENIAYRMKWNIKSLIECLCSVENPGNKYLDDQCHCTPDNDLTFQLNKFMHWLFEENKEKISTYKSEVFDFETRWGNEIFDYYFNHLECIIHWGKWDLVEKSFKWIYTATEDVICSAEDKFSRIKKILFMTFRFEQTTLCYIGRFSLIRRFIMCCFKHNEVNELKEQYSKMDLYFIVNELMRNCNYQKIDDLLEWCFSSDRDKIDEFKLVFMMSFGKFCLFHRIQRHLFDIHEVTSLFKWFKPSTASANLFKEKFITLIKSKKEKVNQVVSKNEKEWVVINENLSESFKALSNCIIKDVLDDEQRNVTHREVIRKSDLILEKILELGFDHLGY